MDIFQIKVPNDKTVTLKRDVVYAVFVRLQVIFPIYVCVLPDAKDKHAHTLT